MFVIFSLILIALFVLCMGFLGIRIPFLTVKKKSKQNIIAEPNEQQILKDKLVKKAIDITPGTSMFLKPENKRSLTTD